MLYTDGRRQNVTEDVQKSWLNVIQQAMRSFIVKELQKNKGQPAN